MAAGTGKGIHTVLCLITSCGGGGGGGGGSIELFNCLTAT